MKTIVIIFLISMLAIAIFVSDAEAKSQSFTIKVSCIVPERLEVTTNNAMGFVQESPTDLSSAPQATAAPSRVQTQQTKFIDGKKTLVYTIVGR